MAAAPCTPPRTHTHQHTCLPHSTRSNTQAHGSPSPGRHQMLWTMATSWPPRLPRGRPPVGASEETSRRDSLSLPPPRVSPPHLPSPLCVLSPGIRDQAAQVSRQHRASPAQGLRRKTRLAENSCEKEQGPWAWLGGRPVPGVPRGRGSPPARREGADRPGAAPRAAGASSPEPGGNSRPRPPHCLENSYLRRQTGPFTDICQPLSQAGSWVSAGRRRPGSEDGAAAEGRLCVRTAGQRQVPRVLCLCAQLAGAHSAHTGPEATFLSASFPFPSLFSLPSSCLPTLLPSSLPAGTWCSPCASPGLCAGLPALREPPAQGLLPEEGSACHCHTHTQQAGPTGAHLTWPEAQAGFLEEVTHS